MFYPTGWSAQLEPVLPDAPAERAQCRSRSRCSGPPGQAPRTLPSPGEHPRHRGTGELTETGVTAAISAVPRDFSRLHNYACTIGTSFNSCCCVWFCACMYFGCRKVFISVCIVCVLSLKKCVCVCARLCSESVGVHFLSVFALFCTYHRLPG